MWVLQLYEVSLTILSPDWLLVAVDIQVDLHMDVSGAFLLVALPADAAAVRLLAAVRQQVFLQVVLGDEGLPAQRAAERTFLPVEPQMSLQVTFGAEALVAEAAAERLRPGVGQHVGVQPSHLPEGFPTDAALEWLLAGVDPLVDLEDVDRRQALPAGVAGDAVGRFVSGVIPDVRSQSAIIDERLPAELADVGPLAAVDPLVAPQGAGPREALPADVAAVWFDAGMAPHVRLDVLVGLTTDVTDAAGVSVRLQVVHQRL